MSHPISCDSSTVLPGEYIRVADKQSVFHSREWKACMVDWRHSFGQERPSDSDRHGHRIRQEVWIWDTSS